MRISHWVVLLTAGAVLSGCATLSEDECLTADWYGIGYADAAAGKASSQVASHRKACSKHGVSLDIDDYLSGYDEGLYRFCTRSVGYSKGLDGYDYTGICPSHLENNFMDGYILGSEIYDASREVRSLSSQLSNQDNKINELEDNIAAKTTLMLSDQVDVAQRYELNTEMENMRDEIIELERSNERLHYQIDDLNALISELELDYRYGEEL
ncbi:DUF2799 domain-containing protein [Reinekea thalattae]|uniref:DUF2799 domain-containing protein n=1 Tax=Reinekea thalattae TaxID=2593301 RepID=A0A5C8ZCE7_9GAMM|nr:DUF2799 domain-containing protein [Reinekea thalattae]TXR54520.1 DUF2799 domain-containing protein [Reinekea thalattae]